MTCIGKAGDGKRGYPSVDLIRRSSNLPPEKRTPGRGVVGRAYQRPSIRRSERRWNIIEVFYTVLVYTIVAPLAFMFWLIQILHGTRWSQRNNKKIIPISRQQRRILANQESLISMKLFRPPEL